ncbi:EF-hand domain-containing protein [Paraburkholderia sp. NMBU_R16]|uniref:EF-hand domain-containing protein n=1 Tax=Paraburkholderia sp. NMBU_R16 TaxID=2698676 RepID=UPI0015678978|nr:EF-hand domain-containing protein [Paraburkholderia sp. NMBU_R16]NRO98975.1 EF-hand domain-containing protein [Paraburkholderia sp. NMBU_R16]
MKHTNISCAIGAALIAFAAVPSAFAQSNLQRTIEARFQSADADHDGKLTLDEAKAGMPRVAAHFDEIDKDHAGYVTVDQIEQYASQHMK